MVQYCYFYVLISCVVCFFYSYSVIAATGQADYWDWYAYKPHWHNEVEQYRLSLLPDTITCIKKANRGRSLDDRCLKEGDLNSAISSDRQSSANHIIYSADQDNQFIYYIKPPEIVTIQGEQYYKVSQLRLFDAKDNLQRFAQYRDDQSGRPVEPGTIKVNFIVFTDENGYPPRASNHLGGEDHAIGWPVTASLPRKIYQHKLSALVKNNVITALDADRFNMEGRVKWVYFTERVAQRLIEDLNQDFSKLSTEIHFKLAQFSYIHDPAYWQLDGQHDRMDAHEALLLLKHTHLALDNHINIFVTRTMRERDKLNTALLGVAYMNQNFTDVQPPVMLLNAALQRRGKNIVHEMGHIIGLAHVVEPGHSMSVNFQNAACPSPITYRRLNKPNCENNVLGVWLKSSCPAIEEYRPTLQLVTPRYQAVFKQIYQCWLEENKLHF